MSDRESNGMTGMGQTAATGPADLNLLRTFLAVHRSGSFTAAARLLGLSQPTVTTQIRALERRLGCELFERQARGVVAVPFADALAARVAAPLDDLAVVTGDEGSAGAAAAGPVRLAGPAELLCLRALPALAPLVAQGVHLRASTGLTDPLLDELRSGQHDLVISTARPRGRALSAVPLMDEEFVLIAAPAVAERVGGPPAVTARGPAALHGMPLITYAEDLPIARRYWRHVFGRRLDTPAAVTVPDLRGVLALIASGAGFSVLPRYLCAAELDSGAVTLLADPEDPPINTAYLVQRTVSAVNPHVGEVRDLLLRAGRTW
ncbi:LysR family transcriptional regulator [Streptomyces sp. NPDC005803]|uniref:LysR family transcriptional regulator n=1 Tax=Streptomyces sp. NPDC005803 TaxID=3154297 RepID=UPI0033FA4D30